MNLDDVKEEQYGSMVRFSASPDLLGEFYKDYGIKAATVPATGVRSVIMKAAVFVCTGKWPREVRLG